MTTCPSEDVLRAYLAENLNRSEAERIDAHLEDCRSCQAALSRLTDESAISLDIGSHPMIQLGPSDDAGLLQVKERLKGSGKRNGSTTNQALSFLDPPQVHGDLGSLGPYRVRTVMGRGGTAIVFKAVDTSERNVALKVLRPELDDRQNRARFLRGGRSALSIRNQHVVEVTSVEDPPKGLPYLVMEYVDGETLHDRVERKKEERLTLREAAEIVRQVAEGLSAAHQQDLVHRDVKSANILLDRVSGRAKIADFGLARNIQLPPEITRQGEVSGTPEYMSREQILTPDRVDARTDVYGLGVVLYHALTGEIPFRGTLLGVLKQVLEDDPVPPRRLNDAIPRDLETICLKCLEKASRQRYASTAALSEDLQRYLAGQPIRAKRAGIVRRGTRWVRRHPVWAAELVVGTVILSSSGVIGFINAAHARAEAKSADELRLAAEARAAAEHREAQTQQHEAEIQQREAMIQRMQRVRLSYQRNGWSSAAWDLARRAATIARDSRIQSEAATTLAGIDAVQRKSFPFPGTGLAFDPKGGRLMISGSSLAMRGPELPVHIWDSTTDQLHTTKIMGEGTFGFRLDGTPLLLKIPRNEPSTAQLLDITSSQVLHTFKPAVQGPSEIRGFALTPDGKWIAVSSRNLKEKGELANTGTIAVWEAATGREIFRTTAQQATDVALAPDASLLAAGHEDGQISVWSLPKGEPIATLKADRNTIQCLVFGRDPVSRSGPRPPGSGWLLATGDAGGGVVVWDPRMRVPRSICQGPTNISEVLTLAFSPDGMTLASAGRNNVKLWDIASGNFLIDVDAGNYVTAFAFSPEGRQLAVGSIAMFGSPDIVNVWDIEPGRGISNLRGLSRSVLWAKFSPDGRLVAALSNDWHVGIWDRAAERLLHVLEVTPGTHTDNAALAFSPDGRRFAFSAGHEASLWDVATGELVKAWSLFEGLTDRLAFPESNRLLLFRVETETGDVGPFSNFNARKYPRVCRIRDLLGPEPLKPLAEIRDCNLHIFESQSSSDGKYYVIEGLGGTPDKKTRIANLYEGLTGKMVGPLPTQSPIDWDSALFNFDPTGTVLNYFYSAKGGQTMLLEMPSRTVLRQLDYFPQCLGPNAKRWLMFSGANADQAAALALLEQDHQAPLIKFLLDVENTAGIGKPQFSPDGLHLVWGNPSGSVTLVTLVEVQRRLAELGLGW